MAQEHLRNLRWNGWPCGLFLLNVPFFSLFWPSWLDMAIIDPGTIQFQLLFLDAFFCALGAVTCFILRIRCVVSKMCITGGWFLGGSVL